MYESFYLSHLKQANIKNGEVIGLCPFHQDSKPSFNARIENGIAYCFGCDWKGNAITFAKELGIPLTEVPGYQKNYHPKRKIVAEYNYHDEKGDLLFQVVRFEPKDFRQRRPDGNGGWIWNLNGTRRVLYRLPLLLSAKEVLIPEGEKDVDNLIDVGFVATTNAGGAKKWRPEDNQYLKNKDVILIPDNDDAGKRHIERIAESLDGIAQSIKIVELPDLAQKGDVSDYLMDHTPDDLQKLIDRTEPFLKIDSTIQFYNFHRTDSGNAESIVELFGDKLRYEHKCKRWYNWKGHTWQADENGAIDRLTIKTKRARLRKSADIKNEDIRAKEAKWALVSESKTHIDAAIKIASKLKPITTTIEEYNKYPMLLGCANGVIDLKTGMLLKGCPEDLISLSTNIYFDPEAKAPRWLQFLSEIFLNDDKLIDYIGRCVGISLTGLTKEQVIFLLYGIGANGKSVFLNIIRTLLGDYAANTSFQTFLSSQYDSSKIPNDVAALVSKRLVTALELKENARINEERIKSMTGGDPINARFLHREWFTYTPEYKIWLAVNHKPKVSDTTYSFWRRIRLIPFKAVFEKDRADLELTEKLLKELPGILNWAIEGCLKWQKEGLKSPDSVTNATNEYQSEMNIVRQFLDEETIKKEGAHVKYIDLYEAYRQWSEKPHEDPMTGNMFGRKMTELGFEKDRIGDDRQRCYKGIGLIDEKRQDTDN